MKQKSTVGGRNMWELFDQIIAEDLAKCRILESEIDLEIFPTGAPEKVS